MGLGPGSNPLGLAKVQIGMGGMSSERVKASAEGPRARAWRLTAFFLFLLGSLYWKASGTLEVRQC